MKDTKVANLLHPIKKEFTLKKVKLRHLPGDDFMRSQWQQQTTCIYYLLYRWAIAIFFLTVVIITMINLFMNGRYFIYLTHWGLLLCMITNVYGAILVTIWHWNPEFSTSKIITTESVNIHLNERASTTNDDDTSVLPWSIKIYWILHMITLNLALVITFIYWSFLYNIQVNAANDGIQTMPDGTLNIFEHAMNSILMIIDLMIIAFPIQILHMIFPICLGLVYGFFSLIYYLAGGVDQRGRRYIYPILDWAKPGLALGTCFGVFVLFVLFSFISFLLYKLRIVIYRKYHQSKMSTFNDS